MHRFSVTLGVTMDNWIKQAVVLFLGVLTILHYSEACSCEFTHPQQQLCKSDFVIKATVKRTDAVFDNPPAVVNEIDAANPNESQAVEQVPFAPLIKGRIYYVKVKKVFKYTAVYGEVEARYKDQDLDLIPIYTSADEGTCGVELMDKVTYLLQGHITDNELHISICENQVEWSQGNIPVYMRKAYGRLFEENCHCQVSITHHSSEAEPKPNECVWDRHYDEDSCFSKHAACMKKDTSDHCKWSRPASLRACLAKTEKRRMQEP